jgi:DAK2 domain fusion protein YloV
MCRTGRSFSRLWWETFPPCARRLTPKRSSEQSVPNIVGAVSAQLGEQAPIRWDAYDGWLRRATSIISESVDALNAMNVFPVPDADTGSNLKLTMTGISHAVPDLQQASLDAAGQAAILCAHGNSGAIIAEMFVSVCRAVEHDVQGLRAMPSGTLAAFLLQLAAVAARRAVARPVAGTILTVADAASAAAAAAAARWPSDALAVVQAAQEAARQSLARTPEQLDVLAAAGVVDAGGQAYLLLVDVLVEILGGAPAQPLATTASSAITEQIEVPRMSGEYEVMYTLRGTPLSDLDALRDRLSELGHSVVIVGDQAIAQVHVHLADAGVAVEAALPLGELNQLRITALPLHSAADRRSLIAVVAGPGMARAVTSLGGVPVLAIDGDAALEQLRAAADQTCGDLVILPNGMENLKRANHLATDLRRSGRRVGIIPTLAHVQGLAAMAVHEPSADFESAVVAMSTAAGHARYAAITVAESAGLTAVGRYELGDVLGTIEGDVVLIGTSLSEVAWQLVERLLNAGGELLTLVRGIGLDDDLLPEITRRVHARFPMVDVELLEGGQLRYPLLLGLE